MNEFKTKSELIETHVPNFYTVKLEPITQLSGNPA